MKDKPKKQSKNFACQMESSIFEKMEKFCKSHRMSKTGFVELAVMEYLAKLEAAEVKANE